jgi:hypothetical protein
MTIRHHHARKLGALVAVAGAAMLIGSSLSAPSAQAGYIVTLTQQGSNVVATGSGTIDLTDLSFNASVGLATFFAPSVAEIATGPVAGIDSAYTEFMGPTSFGSGGLRSPNSGSGDLVGICRCSVGGAPPVSWVLVPQGYVSGSSLSDTSTYDNQTFASLGATPGTYVWTWGSGADADSFTLQIGPAAVPAPLIGRGLPVLLAVGGLFFAAKLLERARKDRLQLG